jgi:hypothetical protein
MQELLAACDALAGSATAIARPLLLPYAHPRFWPAGSVLEDILDILLQLPVRH